MPATDAPITGTAADVPFVAFPPQRPRAGAPLVLAWHLMDPPRTEAAFAAALPLAGLDAWRVYLGLPLSGARAPEGGDDELMRRAYEDAVVNVHGPIATDAVAELPAALAALRERLGAGDGPLGLVGGSSGSAVALLALAESGLRAQAAVLISPVAQLRPVVEAAGRRFGATYAWHDEARAIAARLDFVARADEIAAAGQPALRCIVGADDDAEGFLAPSRRLCDALSARYDDPARVDLVVVPGMGHALADEPGIAPAPQLPHAAEVDRLATEWLGAHLGRS